MPKQDATRSAAPPTRRGGPLPAVLAAAALGGLCLFPAADGRDARTLHENEAWAIFGGNDDGPGCCKRKPECETTVGCSDYNTNPGVCDTKSETASNGDANATNCVNDGNVGQGRCKMEPMPTYNEGDDKPICATKIPCKSFGTDCISTVDPKKGTEYVTFTTRCVPNPDCQNGGGQNPL